MRTFIVTAVATTVAGAGLVLSAGPASAAGAPNENATCLGEVFQAQAVSAPGTVFD